MVVSIALFVLSAFIFFVAAMFGSNGLVLVANIVRGASLLGVLAGLGLMLYHHLQKRKS